jgi:hypothetical protein
VVVGFVRAVFAAKGWNYSEHNLYFWAKDNDIRRDCIPIDTANDP